MRTALEMIDRLEALARRIADAADKYDENPEVASMSAMEEHAIIREARAIVAEMPDPNVVACRHIVAQWNAAKDLEFDETVILSGGMDHQPPMTLALDAYRAGRAAK